MKTITLTDEQFEQLEEYVVENCESIMERSLDWDNTDFIDDNEIIFEFRSILEDIREEYEKKLEKARAKQPKAEW